jgi:iron complex outermembrane receptor protein
LLRLYCIVLKNLIIFFLFFSLSSVAQEDDCGFNLNGKITVVDDDTVHFFSVILTETDKGSLVDQDGVFTIENLCGQRYFLEIRSFGKVLVRDSILISSDTTVNYMIDERTIELSSIDITGELEKKSTVHKTTISPDQIDKSKGLSLGAMLEDVNGVRVLRTGNSIAKPIIHGLHSNRVLILNNSIRQEGQQWGAEHAPEIDPFVSNTISVITGANSIKYGFDAIGGVVLVEPKIISDSVGFSGELNAIGLSNGRQGVVSGNITNRFKKIPSLSLSLQGSLKRGGNYHAPNYFLKNTGIMESNFSTSLNWEKRNYGASVFYSQFNTDLGIFAGSHIGNLTDLQNAFELAEPAEKASFSYFIDRPRQRIEHELTRASFYLRTGKVGKLNLIYGRQYNLRYEYDKDKPLNDSLANLDRPDLQLELTTHTVDLNWEHYAVKGFSGEVGINSIHQKNTYTGRKFIPNFLNQGAGIYLIERKSIKNFLFEGGVRFDYRNLRSFFWENGEIVSPKNEYSDWAFNLGMKYTISPQRFVALNFSRTWRPPSINELYSNGLHHGAASVEIGDENLSRESALSTNIEFNWETDRFQLNVNSYLNYFDNYIFLEPQLPPTLTIKGAFPTFAYKEAEAIIYGVDVFARFEIVKKCYYNVKVSLLRGHNRSISDYLIQMPSDQIQNKLEYTFSDLGPLKKNEISLRHTFVAQQNRIPANSDFAPPPDAYQLLDFSLSTTFSAKNTPISIIFGVNNLLNHSYRDYLNRFRYYSDEMGRNFSLRIKMTIN